MIIMVLQCLQHHYVLFIIFGVYSFGAFCHIYDNILFPSPQTGMDSFDRLYCGHMIWLITNPLPSARCLSFLPDGGRDG